MDGIGCTRLLRAAVLGRRSGLRDVRLKLEGQNPTGSHKDRVAKAMVGHAARRGFSGVSVGTCGNMGVALSRACQVEGLACTVFAPACYSDVRADEMIAYRARVVMVEGSYEDAVQASEFHALEAGLFSCNPLGEAGVLALGAYRDIAHEILEEVGTAPESVWIPVGNGTTFAGVHAGFVEQGLVVKLGGVGSMGNTAAISGMLGRSVVELDPGVLCVTAANEPLLNWKSFHAAEAIQAFMESGGWAYESRDEELEYASAQAFEFARVIVSPGGAAGLAGLFAYERMLDRGRPHVVVLTTGREGSRVK